jgi:hypothetical protein
MKGQLQLLMVQNATMFIPGFVGEVRVAHFLVLFVLSCYESLRSKFRAVMSVTISATTTKNDVRFSLAPA